jgi:bifunctional diaminopimelate decarboxylase / aspartate kinase
MSAATAAEWIVLKFGGTSVSSLANWRNIATVVRARSAGGARVLIVHSALSGVTDRLEKLLAAAAAGAAPAGTAAAGAEYAPALAALEQRHRQLAAELGVELTPAFAQTMRELGEALAGIAAAGTVSDRTRARVMASGELLATELGVQFLRGQGIDCRAFDARAGLRSEPRAHAASAANYLSGTCDFSPDPGLAARLAALAPVVITQGFIAANAAGDTVLLGRGGSDTSGAYFAAKLEAARLEIWTDVPGMFSANPHATPAARLLRALHYDEAQEIASAGAKVLHPRCILPVRQAQIPLWIYATQTPQLEGTHISASGGDGAAQVKAVCIKKGITLLALESPGMWHEVGFLADAFDIFKRHGMSVDQVSTSETNVTVSLDPSANAIDHATLEALVAELERLCRVQLIGPCAQVSLVGRNIRGILHQLGAAFEVFAEQRIYMVSQAANDLNFTFVVDEAQGDRLVQELHDLLIRPVAGDSVLGPSWAQLYGITDRAAPTVAPWWQLRRAELLQLAAAHDCAFVYDGAVVEAAARQLRSIKSVDRIFYAMKANSNAALLRIIAAAGLGFDCVSRGELEHLHASVPRLERGRVLFTPNFAARAEYAWALEQGVLVTIDNLYVLQHWPELFRDRAVLVRVDTGTGRGHHHHVRTAGEHAKFGIPLGALDELARLAGAAGCRVVGLHAHSGSGIFEIGSWAETAALLIEAAPRFPALECINVGGGLAVPERHEQAPVDLAQLDAALAAVRERAPRLEFWLEPGRFLVAAAGVLLARVTQTKSKDETRYVGVATGMNSLIRPALYGAWHEIVNLTRLDQPATELVNVVGPICESADVLGHDRLLPPTREGDVLLIANAGAYGRAMSSSYNLRAPAVELVL